jgi:hypothetical protein
MLNFRRYKYGFYCLLGGNFGELDVNFCHALGFAVRQLLLI